MEYKIFGCRLNKYFLNKWLKYFKSNDLYGSKSILIASCVVTDRAKSKWLKLIKSYLGKGYRIYLTGCGVLDKGKLMNSDYFYSVYTELYEFSDKIVLLEEEPNDDKHLFDNINNIFTKNFVVIQNGCDNHCSFCMTVKKRGSSYSYSQSSIVDQIKKIEKQGSNEIVLTGVNIASWGCENTQDYTKSKFADLLETILTKTSIPRIRLSSLGPQYLNNHFFEVIENDRIMPYFHLSIQSFSDKILKLMGRPYDFRIIESIVKKFRNLNRKDSDLINLGADIIVGFPGEKDHDFALTLKVIAQFGLTKLHVFPFSPHIKYENVPASSFENQLTRNIIKNREKELLKLAQKNSDNFVEKNIGKIWEFMVEENKNGYSKGWTPNYLQVKTKGKYNQGDLIKVKFSKNEEI